MHTLSSDEGVKALHQQQLIAGFTVYLEQFSDFHVYGEEAVGYTYMRGNSPLCFYNSSSGYAALIDCPVARLQFEEFLQSPEVDEYVSLSNIGTRYEQQYPRKLN